MSEQLEGYFISFSAEDKAKLDRYLLSNSYEAGIDGLKAYLTDKINAKEARQRQVDSKIQKTKVLAQQVATALGDNPEAIGSIIEMFGNMLGNKKAREAPGSSA